MNRDICGICWGAYDDAGRCECKPQSEPVAWMHTNAVGHVYFRKKPQDKVFNPQPVYTEPVSCPNCASLKAELEQHHLYQPVLTDEIIADLWYQNGTYYHHFARAIERYLTRK